MFHLISILYGVQLLFDVIDCQEIFAALKCLFLNKFSWLADATVSLDDMDSKIRGATSPKHINSDILTLLTICGLIFALAIVSATCSNGDIDFTLNDIDTNTTDVLDNRSLSLSGPSLVLSNFLNGNEELISSGRCCKCPLLEIDFPSPPDSIHTCTSTQIVSVPNSQLNANTPQHSQKTQTSERFLQKLDNSHEWIVRYTRSGHVYGRYPL